MTSVATDESHPPPVAIGVDCVVVALRGKAVLMMRGPAVGDGWRLPRRQVARFEYLADCARACIAEHAGLAFEPDLQLGVGERIEQGLEHRIVLAVGGGVAEGDPTSDRGSIAFLETDELRRLSDGAAMSSEDADILVQRGLIEARPQQGRV